LSIGYEFISLKAARFFSSLIASVFLSPSTASFASLVS